MSLTLLCIPQANSIPFVLRYRKTRLVQEFIVGKEEICFLADSIAESEQLKSLGRVVREHFRDTILTDFGFKESRLFQQNEK